MGSDLTTKSLEKLTKVLFYIKIVSLALVFVCGGVFVLTLFLTCSVINENDTHYMRLKKIK